MSGKSSADRTLVDVDAWAHDLARRLVVEYGRNWRASEIYVALTRAKKATRMNEAKIETVVRVVCDMADKYDLGFAEALAAVSAAKEDHT